MRREQVHKICLNHVLTRDIVYNKKDDKTWLFAAADFSEGEIDHCSFCLRFKTAEVAEEFMKAINDALKRTGSDGKITIITTIDYNTMLVGTCVAFAALAAFAIWHRQRL